MKSAFAAFCAFSQAARTAQTTTDIDLLCLCNRTVVPRQTPRHLLENKLAFFHGKILLIKILVRKSN